MLSLYWLPLKVFQYIVQSRSQRRNRWVWRGSCSYRKWFVRIVQHPCYLFPTSRLPSLVAVWLRPLQRRPRRISTRFSCSTSRPHSRIDDTWRHLAGLRRCLRSQWDWCWCAVQAEPRDAKDYIWIHNWTSSLYLMRSVCSSRWIADLRSQTQHRTGFPAQLTMQVGFYWQMMHTNQWYRGKIGSRFRTACWAFYSSTYRLLQYFITNVIVSSRIKHCWY